MNIDYSCIFCLFICCLMPQLLFILKNEGSDNREYLTGRKSDKTPGNTGSRQRDGADGWVEGGDDRRGGQRRRRRRHEEPLVIGPSTAFSTSAVFCPAGPDKEAGRLVSFLSLNAGHFRNGHPDERFGNETIIINYNGRESIAWQLVMD